MIYSLFSHLPNFFRFSLTPWPEVPFSQLPKLYTLKIPRVHLREKASPLTSLTSTCIYSTRFINKVLQSAHPLAMASLQKFCCSNPALQLSPQKGLFPSPDTASRSLRQAAPPWSPRLPQISSVPLFKASNFAHYL